LPKATHKKKKSHPVKPQEWQDLTGNGGNMNVAQMGRIWGGPKKPSWDVGVSKIENSGLGHKETPPILGKRVQEK